MLRILLVLLLSVWVMVIFVAWCACVAAGRADRRDESMTKKVLAELTTSDGGKGFVFFCPGCKYYHDFRTEAGSDKSRPIWAFDGNLEKPTFSPSLLVNGFVPEVRCHTFVRNGQIQYLSDCFHELKNQTVDMEEIDW